MARFGDLDTQYFDDAGDPLAYGRVYFYESGTTTPKTTYADVNNSIPNTNPVLLTAAGRQPNIFFDGVARAILTNSSDVQIAVRDPVGETATDFGDQWVATKVYSSTDVVLGSDGIYYRSLINGNQNNNPVTTSGYWTLLYSVEWNVGITYDIGAVVTYNNQQYQSLQSSNVGNNPSSATSYWVPLNFAWMASATYAINQNVVGTDGILYTSLQNANTGNDPASSPAWWVGTSAAAAASATAAAASATAAAASETAAAASETAAAASETNAAQSATDAATSETNAAQSATDAATSATNAATSETNAAASETAAAGSATAAASSATAAASSASAASTSETNAASSATAAAASETAAAASESAAATSATNAANSATASATSASDSATSATASAGSATSAASSATAAAGSATSAASSATAAATSASDAATKYDEFDDRYLGSKSSDPSVDNDGNPLITGALYFNDVSNLLRVYNGSSWQDAGSSVNGTSQRQTYTATSGQTVFAVTYDVGFVDVYLNGSKLLLGTDFTATTGSDITLTTGATTGDIVDIIAYGSFQVANTYTKTEADAKFATISTTQTLTNKTVEAVILNNGYTEETYTLSGTELNPANGTLQSAVLSGNITFTDGFSSGQSMMLMLENGSTYSVTWPTITWATSTGNTPPTLTAKDALTFWKIGSTLYGAYVGGYA